MKHTAGQSSMWIRRDRRGHEPELCTVATSVRCAAIAATDDAVLIEWGSGQAKTATLVWVKHRVDAAATPVS